MYDLMHDIWRHIKWGIVGIILGGIIIPLLIVSCSEDPWVKYEREKMEREKARSTYTHYDQQP